MYTMPRRSGRWERRHCSSNRTHLRRLPFFERFSRYR